MKFYQNVKRDINPPVDLTVLGNTYNTLQQGHIKALELKTQLETAVSQLEMDPSEDAYKAQLVDGITKAVDENAIGGNMYYSIPELIKQQGNIAKNPGVLGRVRANAARKAFIGEVNKMDIDEDIKAMAIEMSPYYYEDKYDTKGNVIGGSEWAPGYTPVKQIDFNKLITDAIKIAHPDKGKGTGAIFMDSDGNRYSQYVDGTDAYVWSESTMEYERLSPDKLQAAILNAIQNTPGAMASLNQDRIVGLWKSGKIDENEENALQKKIAASNGALDENGSEKSFSRYIYDRINPSIYAAQYDNKFVTTKYHNDAIKAKEQKKENDALSSLMFGANQNPLVGATSIPGPIEMIKDNSASDAVLSVTQLNQDIKKNLREIGIEESLLKGNLYRDLNNIQELINSSNASDEIKQQKFNIIKRNILENSANIKWLDDNREILTDKSKNAFNFVQAIEAGVDPNLEEYNNKKEYITQYNRIIDNIYKDGDIIYFNASRNKIDKIIKLYGEDKLTNDGFIIDYDKGNDSAWPGNKGGHKRIGVPKEIAQKIPDLLDVIDNSKRKNIFASPFELPVTITSEDGRLATEGPGFGKKRGENRPGNSPLDAHRLKGQFDNLINSANKQYSKETKTGTEIPVVSQSYAAIVPMHYYYNQALQNPNLDPKTRTALKSTTDYIEQNFERNINELNFRGSNFSISDREDGVIRKLDENEKKKFQAAWDKLKPSDRKVIAENAHIFESNYNSIIHPMIKVPIGNKYYDIILDDGFMNEEFASYNRLALTKQKGELKQSINTGKPIQFGWLQDTPIYLVPINDKNGKYYGHGVQIGNEEPIFMLNAEEALTYMGAKDDLLELREKITTGKTSLESDEVKAEISSALYTFGLLFGSQTPQYITNIIGF